MVREAGKGDEKALAELMLLLWPEHSEAELLAECEAFMEDENAGFFLKYEQGVPAGFAQCQLRHDYVEGTRTSPVGYLEGIFVREEYRRRGYGTELLRACEAWAAKRGCREFASDCELDNADSFRFHMAAGFLEANRVICFVKELKQP